MNKKRRVMSLSATAPGAEEYVKKEDALVEEVNGSCVGQPSSTSRKEYEVLQLTIMPSCLVDEFRGSWNPWSNPARIYLR